MGWSSGTNYFDPYVELVVKYVPKEKQEDLIYDWYRTLKDEDWDTEDESEYWDFLKEILVKKDPDRWRTKAHDVADVILEIMAFKYPDTIGDNDVKAKIIKTLEYDFDIT